jgi:NAD(P)-dependent dehydrogenase (short-subunit alcohol dehydrogenase family)
MPLTRMPSRAQASPLSAYITGQTLVVDGGLTLA